MQQEPSFLFNYIKTSRKSPLFRCKKRSANKLYSICLQSNSIFPPIALQRPLWPLPLTQTLSMRYSIPNIPSGFMR